MNIFGEKFGNKVFNTCRILYYTVNNKDEKYICDIPEEDIYKPLNVDYYNVDHNVDYYNVDHNVDSFDNRFLSINNKYLGIETDGCTSLLKIFEKRKTIISTKITKTVVDKDTEYINKKTIYKNKIIKIVIKEIKRIIDMDLCFNYLRIDIINGNTNLIEQAVKKFEESVCHNTDFILSLIYEACRYKQYLLVATLAKFNILSIRMRKIELFNRVFNIGDTTSIQLIINSFNLYNDAFVLDPAIVFACMYNNSEDVIQLLFDCRPSNNRIEECIKIFKEDYTDYDAGLYKLNDELEKRTRKRIITTNELNKYFYKDVSSMILSYIPE
jgi:hypothetical protein